MYGSSCLSTARLKTKARRSDKCQIFHDVPELLCMYKKVKPKVRTSDINERLAGSWNSWTLASGGLHLQGSPHEVLQYEGRQIRAGTYCTTNYRTGRATIVQLYAANVSKDSRAVCQGRSDHGRSAQPEANGFGATGVNSSVRGPDSACSTSSGSRSASGSSRGTRSNEWRPPLIAGEHEKSLPST